MLPVSLLIVTRHRRDDLARCLASVARQAPAPSEVVLLDNAADVPLDADAMAACVAPIPLRLLRVEHPEGVAAARQRLLDATTAPVALLIDDDAVLVDPDTVAGVAQHFAGHPRSAALALLIEEYRDGRPRWETPGGTRDAPPTGSTRCAGYFVGAGHALRVAAVAGAGGYDPRFVYGEEELDLAYRLVAAGHQIHFAPGLRLTHHPGPTPASVQDERLRRRVATRLLLAWRYLPMPYALTFSALWLGYWLQRAARQRRVAAWAAGLREGIRLVGTTPRTPLGPEAVRYLKRCGGRLWW